MILRFIIIISLLSLSHSVWAQNIWEPANGPDAPHDTRAVAANSLHYIFAATGLGVYRSTNGGVDWLKVNSGLTNTDVRAIAIDSKDHIFVGTNLGGVYLSTDNGNSWSASSNGITFSNVYFLSISPNDQLYAGSPSGHVFRSTNNGKIWDNISPPASDMYTLTVDSNGIIYSGGSGIFRSRNNGVSWDIGFAHCKTPIQWAACMACSNNRIYLGNDSGIFISSDSGSNWVRLPLGSKSQYPPFLFTFANVSQVACKNGVIITATNIGNRISKDDGNGWIAVNSNFDLNLSAVASDSSKVLFAANAFGVLHSFDSGITWLRVNSNDLPPCQINSLAKSSSGKLFAATACGVYASYDDGDHWSLSLFGGPDYHGGGYSPIIALDNDLVLVNSNGILERSSDGGITWTGITSGIYGITAINADHIVALSPLILVRSEDGGLSWTTTPKPQNTDRLYCIALSLNGEVYAGGLNSDNGTGIFRSSDYGRSWQYLAFDKRDVFSINALRNGSLFANENGWYYRSTDTGTSWTEVATNDVSAICNKEGTIFLGSSRSTDNGNTWTDFSSGLPQNWVLGPMAIDSNGRLFGGDNGQVFRTVSSTLKVAEGTKGVQTTLQIYPNPTSGIVNIDNTPSNNIEINVINMLGETVMKLKNLDNQNSSLNLSKLIPGIYYVRLSSPNSIINRKIIKE